MTIAIDGPSGVGKTSVGEALARRLKCAFLDTGLMYRAVTYLALHRSISLDDEKGLGRLAAHCRIEARNTVGLSGTPRTVFIDGEDVTEAVKSRLVEAGVSQVARVPAVRKALVKRQREIARAGNIVMAGRDIGTVVLPKASHKFYLTASPSQRARRRYRELAAAGQDTSYAEVLSEIQERDALDSGRAISPLRPAHDAIGVDTDHLSLEQVVEKLYRTVTGS